MTNEAARARYEHIARTAQLDHMAAARDEIVENRMNKDSFADRDEVVEEVASAAGWQIIGWFERVYDSGWIGFIADLDPEPVR